MRTYSSLISIIRINYQRSAWQLKMENSLERKEFVAMFMESPFYFDLRPRERLFLVQQHQHRFSIKVRAANPARPIKVASDRPKEEMPVK